MIQKKDKDQKKIEACHEIISAWKFRALRAESKLKESEKFYSSLPSAYEFNSMKDENQALKRRNEIFSKRILGAVLAVVLLLNLVIITGTMDHLNYSQQVDDLKSELQFLSMRNSTLQQENQTLYEVNDQFFEPSKEVKEMQEMEKNTQLMVMESEETF